MEKIKLKFTNITQYKLNIIASIDKYNNVIVTKSNNNKIYVNDVITHINNIKINTLQDIRNVINYYDDIVISINRYIKNNLDNTCLIDENFTFDF